jgi:subtilisin-like proprotein convertase family protein
VNIKSICAAAAALFTLGVAGSAQAAVISTVFSTNTPVAICDVCTVTSTLDFTSHGRVIDVNALIDITHTYDADLIISLSHGGRSVLLSNRQGGSGGQNYTNTVFDDQATVAINAGFAYAPYTGAFRPEQFLSAFNDLDAFGLWTLSVTDLEAGDDGTINRFGITAAVPEPGSLGLLGLGLAGFAAARRRKA